MPDLDHSEDFEPIHPAVFVYHENADGQMMITDTMGTPLTHEEAYRYAEALWRYLDETDPEEMLRRREDHWNERMRVLASFSQDRGILPPAELVDERAGFVYLMKSGSLYKIGKTRQIEERLKSLRNGSAEVVELVQTIAVPDMHRSERFWHGHFATRRKHGEWFDLTDIDVIEFCTFEKRTAR